MTNDAIGAIGTSSLLLGSPVLAGINYLWRTSTPSEVNQAYAMAAQCDAYKESVIQINQDAQQYIIETIDNINEEIKNLKNDTQKQIDELITKCKELEKKLEDDSLTQEEREKLQQEYDGTKAQIASIQGNSTTKGNQLNNTLNEKNEQFFTQNNNFLKEAESFASDTKEFAQPMADQHVSGGVFKKMFGISGKQKKIQQAGTKAVESANNLKTEIDTTTPILGQITFTATNNNNTDSKEVVEVVAEVGKIKVGKKKAKAN